MMQLQQLLIVINVINIVTAAVVHIIWVALYISHRESYKPVIIGCIAGTILTNALALIVLYGIIPLLNTIIH